jgi:hypothetical protein
MRRLACCCGAVTLLLCASLAQGVPWDPKVAARQEKLAPYDHRSYSRHFDGGRRAIAIAVGNGKSFLNLHVYDADGNCVAHDDAVTLTSRDDVAVEWLPPPAGGTYTVEIHNLGRGENDYLFSMRQDKSQ